MLSAAPTLSSMVSNLDSTMPSMSLVRRALALRSARRSLNLESWSTASLPTKASPTKSVRSGSFMLMSLDSARMSGSLSCIRPAVSTSTASHPCRAAALIASAATFAGSFSYPRSKRGTPRRLQCVLSCSTAPARKVSHAAIITLTSCCRSQYATLDRFVDLPTPLTPTKTIVYGLPASFAARTSRRISTLRFGVKILVSASSIADRTMADSELNDASLRPLSDAATDSHSRSAMSSATFLFMKLVFNRSSTGSRSSSSSALLPTTPCTSELPKTPDSHDFFFLVFLAASEPSFPSPSSSSESESSSE